MNTLKSVIWINSITSINVSLQRSIDLYYLRIYPSRTESTAIA